MPKYNTAQNAFNWGELGAEFLGRTETEQYKGGCKRLINMIPLVGGGVIRRPGTVYVDRVEASSTLATGSVQARVIPYIISNTTSWGLLLYTKPVSGGVYTLYIQPYAPNGLMSATLSPFTSMTNTGQIPLQAQYNLSTAQYCQIGSELFLVDGANPPIRIAYGDPGHTGYFTCIYAMGYDPPLGSSGTYYNEVLNRPYNSPNLSAITMTPAYVSGGSGGPPITAGSLVTLTASGNFFTSAMYTDNSGTGDNYANTIIKLTQLIPNGSTYSTGVVQLVPHVGNSATVCYGTVIIPIVSTSATSDWQDSQWSNQYGYPATVSSYQGRLVFGGNATKPDTVWASEAENQYQFMNERLAQDLAATSDQSGLNFFGAVADTDPSQYQLLSNKIQAIQWMATGKSFTVGTLGQEFSAIPNTTTGSALGALTPSFIDFSTNGSSFVQAVRINNKTVFVSLDGTDFLEYYFDNFTQNFLADHFNSHAADIVLRSTIEQLQANPLLAINPETAVVQEMQWMVSRHCLWANANNGLIGFTFDPDNKTKAWHRHILGGNALDGGGNPIYPTVQGIANIPSTSTNKENLWVVVLRRINGHDYFMLEIMGQDYIRPDLFHNGGSSISLPYFMDAAAVATGSSVSRFAGFSHLIGQTVDVIADGKPLPQVVVDSGGHVNLPNGLTASQVIAGLPAYPLLQMVPTDSGTPFGNAFGMKTRADRITLRLINSAGVIIQSPNNSVNTEEMIIYPGANNAGVAYPFYTGDIHMQVPEDPDRRMELIITQNQPLPLQITGLALRGVTYE